MYRIWLVKNEFKINILDFVGRLQRPDDGASVHNVGGGCQKSKYEILVLAISLVLLAIS